MRANVVVSHYYAKNDYNFNIRVIFWYNIIVKVVSHYIIKRMKIPNFIIIIIIMVVFEYVTTNTLTHWNVIMKYIPSLH